jgi:RNA polymerase sigma factor (sigma-70 family)
LKEITSEKILKGIVENDREIIQYVYRKYFSSVENYVLKHRGTREDARDLFQDGIVIVYEQVKNKNLIIKSSFYTYFYSVCKYQWLKLLREKDNKYFESIDENVEFDRSISLKAKHEMDELIEKESRIKVYQKHYKNLSKECQILLKLVARGFKPDEIKETMNFKSVGYTYKKRRICKERLITLIKNDEGYKNT